MHGNGTSDCGHRRDGRSLLGRDAIGHADFLAVKAHPDREIGTHRIAAGVDDLNQEPGTAGQVTTILVGSLVGGAGEEVGDEIGVGAVNFDAVEAGLACPARGTSEALHDGANFVPVQLAGHLAAAGSEVRRRDGLNAGQPRFGDPASMKQLDCCRGTGLMDGVGQARQPGEAAIIVDPRLVEHAHALGKIDTTALDDNQSGAAPRPLGVVGHLPLGDQALSRGEAGTHGCHDYPVAQLQLPNPPRFQKPPESQVSAHFFLQFQTITPNTGLARP